MITLTKIDILGSVEHMFNRILVHVASGIAVLFFLLIAPVVLVALPLYMIFHNPHQNLTWLAQAFYWASPPSCGVWMVIYSQWSLAHQWRVSGRDLEDFRRSHGGIAKTLSKSLLYMIVAVIASYFFETVYIVVFHKLFHRMPLVPRETLGFLLFPVSAYAPIILLWLKRQFRQPAMPALVQRPQSKFIG